jgi:hypothetical protein
MLTYQHTVFTVLDRYDTLYAVNKSDVGVDFKIDTDLASPQCFETCS